MPTERFYNLPAGKKDIIREAALKEFVRVPFEKASINKIVHKAGISRGSFYTYFKDKSDVLDYLFEYISEKIKKRWNKCDKELSGDLWKISKTFLEYCIINIKKEDFQLINNLSYNEKFFEIHRLKRYEYSKKSVLLEVMYSSIDKSGFKNLNIETFGNILSMIFFALIECMRWYYCHPEDEEKVKKEFCEKLEVLQYGICKNNLNQLVRK